jgi:integrase
MSVYWDKTKKRWRIEVTRDGQRLRKVAPAGLTKGEAEAWESQIVLNHFRQTQMGEKPEYTVVQAITKWAEERLPAMKSEDNARSHAAQLLGHIEGWKLSEVHHCAATYVAKNKDLAAATLYQRLAILRLVANLAYKRWGWLDAPVADKIEMPRVNNARHIYLTPEELQRLLVAAPNQAVEDAILIGAYTGLRLGEIMGLTPASIQDDLILLGIETKTGRPRAVPIHPVLGDAIARLPLGVSKRHVQQGFTRARAQVGLEHVHFHDLRHTCASWLVQAGVPLYTAGALLGHSSVKTTQRYAHLAVENLRDAMSRI